MVTGAEELMAKPPGGWVITFCKMWIGNGIRDRWRNDGDFGRKSADYADFADSRNLGKTDAKTKSGRAQAVRWIYTVHF